MKKGVSHVDWVISMGIFIVYIMALFIFLRPGISVEHKPQALLDLIEQRVKDEIVVVVKETPLYVSKCLYEAPPINKKGEIIVRDLKGKWMFVKIFEGVLDVSSRYISGDDFKAVCAEGSDTEPELSDVLFSLNYIVKEKPGENEVITPSLFLEFAGDASAELRASENKYYVYDNWLDVNDWVEDGDYGKLKEKFGFPKTEDFAIYFLKDGEKLGDTEMVVGSDKKPEQGNVYIIEWKDNYITNNYGSIGEIVVHIEVW